MGLVGVTELSIERRSGESAPPRPPLAGFVFDPHRLALPCWAQATGGEAALLLTFDRHFDTVAPVRLPPNDWRGGGQVAELDTYCRTQLDPRNVDHLLAAMEAGIVSDAVLVARATPRGAVTAPTWTDSQGRSHRLLASPTLDALVQDYGSDRASPQTRELRERIAACSRILLDVDLDCFTSPNDADPTTVVPWPEDLIHDFLFPRGAEPFWEEVLVKCVGLTLAREPKHCGGLVAMGRLFENVARVLFVDLLESDLP